MRVVRYLTDHAIASVGLVCSLLALAGSPNAAFSRPARSVGPRQIRSHAIGSRKPNPGDIAASIRAWVNLQWRGQMLVAKQSSARVIVRTGHHYETVAWPHRSFAKSCFPMVTPQLNATHNNTTGTGPVPPDQGGFATVELTPRSSRGASLFVKGFPAYSAGAYAQAAYVMIVCPSRKPNPGDIAASVRAWVNVQWRGQTLVAKQSSAHVIVQTTTHYETITWPRRSFATSCFPMATPQLNASHNNPTDTGPVPPVEGGFATVELTPSSSTGASLFVEGFPANYVRNDAQAAYVMIVCPSRMLNRGNAASIRAWVNLQWRGQMLLAKQSSARVIVRTGHHYETVAWPHRSFAKSCFPMVTPQLNATHNDPSDSGPIPPVEGGFATVELTPRSSRGASLFVKGFPGKDAQAAYVMIVCP